MQCLFTCPCYVLLSFKVPYDVLLFHLYHTVYILFCFTTKMKKIWKPSWCGPFVAQYMILFPIVINQIRLHDHRDLQDEIVFLHIFLFLFMSGLNSRFVCFITECYLARVIVHGICMGCGITGCVIFCSSIVLIKGIII